MPADLTPERIAELRKLAEADEAEMIESDRMATQYEMAFESLKHAYDDSAQLSAYASMALAYEIRALRVALGALR